MADVLGQDEVDALLNAVAGGEVEGAEDGSGSPAGAIKAAEGKEPEIRSYDFKRPERVSKDQMMAFTGLHERFARNFGAALSGYLRTIIEVKVKTTEQLTYAEFTYSLPVPTLFCLLSTAPLEGGNLSGAQSADCLSNYRSHARRQQCRAVHPPAASDTDRATLGQPHRRTRTGYAGRSLE